MRVHAIAAVALLSFAAAARTQEPPPPPTEDPPPPAAEPATAGDARDLEQRLRILERKLELKEEQEAEAAKTRPQVSVGKEGFSLRSADGAFALKIRGAVQVDGRFYTGAEPRPADTFVLRRARPIVEATLFRIFDVRVMTDFGGNTSSLQDAYMDARLHKAARLRVGKFKPPVGLERLQAEADLLFVERAFPTGLVPSRDVGAQLGGEVLGGRVEYGLAVLNGVVDGGFSDSGISGEQEVAARLAWKPLQPADGSVARTDFGLALAATRGGQHGTATTTLLANQLSPGQQAIFAYRADGTAAGTVLADGLRRRLAPQAWLYRGPLGILAEWTRSEQRVRRGAETADLALDAWQLQASWVLTREDNSFRGVSPRVVFDPRGNRRGAWIVAVRASGLEADEAAFPLYADPARAVRSALTLGASVSWNFSRGVRWVADYDSTSFEGGAARGDRPTEQAFFTRFQISF